MPETTARVCLQCHDRPQHPDSIYCGWECERKAVALHNAGNGKLNQKGLKGAAMASKKGAK
jgi:hypothetical protein